MQNSLRHSSSYPSAFHNAKVVQPFYSMTECFKHFLTLAKRQNTANWAGLCYMSIIIHQVGSFVYSAAIQYANLHNAGHTCMRSKDSSCTDCSEQIQPSSQETGLSDKLSSSQKLQVIFTSQEAATMNQIKHPRGIPRKCRAFEREAIQVDFLEISCGLHSIGQRLATAVSGIEARALCTWITKSDDVLFFDSTL